MGGASGRGDDHGRRCRLREYTSCPVDIIVESILQASRTFEISRLRLHILSDLHTEFAPYDITPVDADVLVLAGDIGSGTRGLEVVEQVRDAYDTVIDVAGNHEYYKHATPRLDAKLRECADALGVTVLENESAIVGGVRILGCTFWTDVELFAPAIPRHVAIAAAESRMADYRAIRVSPEYRRLRTVDVLALHSGSRGWLKQELTRAHDGPRSRSADFTCESLHRDRAGVRFDLVERGVGEIEMGGRELIG